MAKNNFEHKISRDTVDESIKIDSLITFRFFNDLKKILLHDSQYVDFVNERLTPIEVARTFKWWSKRGGIPDQLVILKQMLEQGIKPILATVSLKLEACGNTVYLPVPYGLINCYSEAKSRKKIKKALCENILLNLDPDFNRDFKVPYDDAILFIQSISHSLLNLSYSLRLDDNPIIGYLANAHSNFTRLYIPDVAELTKHEGTNPEIQSAAIIEEKYLGMASVIYLPLFVNPEKEDNCEAVLVLWSPVPGLWDHGPCDISDNPNNLNLKGITFPKSIENLIYKSSIQNKLDWLYLNIAKDNFAIKRFNNQTIQFLGALTELSKDRSVKISVIHGLEKLISLIIYGENRLEKISLKGALEILLTTNKGILYKAAHAESPIVSNEEEFNISFDFTGNAVLDKSGIKPAYKKKELKDFFSKIDDSLELKFNEENTLLILNDPFNNMLQYSEKFENIEIKVSNKFLTVRYNHVPKKTSLSRLLNGEEGFKTYYGIRRGFSIHSGSEKTYGMGISLFNVAGDLTNFSRRLYLSPGGEKCYDEIWLPLNLIEWSN